MLVSSSRTARWLASRSASSTTTSNGACACAPARHSRSMEEEARHLLALHLAAGPAANRHAATPDRRGGERRRDQGFRRGGAARAPCRAVRQTHPSHHRRRHRGLQIARPDPAPEGARHGRACRDDARRAGIRHAAGGRRDRGRARPYRPVRRPHRVRHRHIRLARDTDLIVVAPATADLMAKMAGGHADDLASTVLLATDRPVLIAPAMKPAHVGPPGDPPQPGAALRRRHRGRRPQCGRDGRARRKRHGTHGRAAGDRRRRRGAARARARPADRQARADHLGPDPRADRSGALHRQPILGQAGSRHRARRRGGRRRGDAGVGPGERARPARRQGPARRERARHAGGGGGRVAGRRRDLRRRRRRLAGRAGERGRRSRRARPARRLWR